MDEWWKEMNRTEKEDKKQKTDVLKLTREKLKNWKGFSSYLSLLPPNPLAFYLQSGDYTKDVSKYTVYYCVP